MLGLRSFINSTFAMIEGLLCGESGYRIETPNNPIHPCWEGLEADSMNAFNEAQSFIRDWSWGIKMSIKEIDQEKFSNERVVLGKYILFIYCSK